jgi:exonuclease SbcC
MVPLSLTLRNFLSYGDNEVTLDFSNMHVVCLSGENGHGKSALLDAITWVLWGETRLGKQGHEHLIRIGADEMSVVLTFRIGRDVYRVKRQRSRRTTGANWEIQRSDGENGWRALTGTSSADTGKTIQQIVRMSYDTFLNSSYLKQGRADEFVRQTSNRRKEILCDILELGRYDQLEEKAKLRAREAIDISEDLDRQLNQARVGANDGERFRAELTDANARLAVRSAEHSRLLQERRSADRHRSELINQMEIRRGLTNQLSNCRSSITKVKNDKRAAEVKVGKLLEVLKDRDLIERDYAELHAARSRQAEIADGLRELSDLRLALVKCEASIEQERQTLEESSRYLKNEVSAANKSRVEFSRVVGVLNQIEISKAKYSGLNTNSDELNRKKDELISTFSDLRADNEAIDKEIKAEGARHERLLSQQENCSICGSPLPEEKIAELLGESDEKINTLKLKLESIKTEGTKVKRIMAETDARLNELRISKQQLQSLDNELIKLEQQKDQAESGMSGLEAYVERLVAVESLLSSNGFSRPLRLEQAALQKRKMMLAPLEAEYQKLTQTLRALLNSETAHQKLITADRDLLGERRIAAIAHEQLVSLEEQESSLAQQIETLDGVEDRLRGVELDLNHFASEEAHIFALMSEAQQLVGRLHRSIEQCQDAEAKIKTFEAERDKSRNEENLHKLLAAAFGKRGIQASIIETALPELELYTNEILDRLTDGDLRVFIETTRLAKAKKSAPVETLEIKISDSLGTRPLEMYSGGEAFRVSFALRIALSMLLVRRAGAELQTLIIDEGFGTQDAKGREKLVDAINAIKQDFDQILVITHIDELKEAFATRIEVYKTSEGSQLRVVHDDAIG